MSKLASEWRLGLTLWLAGMAGVAVMAWTVVPQLPLPAQAGPPAVAITATLVQGGVVLALMVWGGLVCNRRLGLAAPAIEAALAGRPAGPVWQRLWPAGAWGAVAIAVWLLVLAQLTPEGLREAGRNLDVPALAKLLYGGVTEEVLLRWGAMTVAVWLVARLLQPAGGPPRVATLALGNAAAALLFGLGHLPMLAALHEPYAAGTVAYVVLGNAVPALLLGWLYARRGLEAAMLAHGGAHALVVLITLN